MALSGSTVASYGNNGSLQFKLSWSATQSIINNTSTLSWKVEEITNAYGVVNSTANKALKIYIGRDDDNSNSVSRGEEFFSTEQEVKIGIAANTTRVLATNSYVFKHNADGTLPLLSIRLSLNCGITYSGAQIGTVSLQVFPKLDTLPRKAVLNTAPNFNDEENPKITYTNLSGSALTSLQACISWTGADDIAYRDISKSGTSYTFNFTDAEREKLRAAVVGSNSRAVVFYVRSVLNGVTYYSTLTKTLTIVNNTPTLSPVVKDVGTGSTVLTGDENKIIKGYNYISVSSGAVAKKGATIVSQKVTCGSTAINSGTGSFANVESATFVFTATDSRGNTVSKTIQKELIPYIPLTSNIDGKITLDTVDSTKATIQFTTTGNYYTGSFGAVDNTLTLSYSVESSDGGWYGETLEIPADAIKDNTYTLSYDITDLNYLYNYTVEIQAKDKINTVKSLSKVFSATPIFDWGESDFNFNVPVTIQGNALADFVIEEGNDNLYSYRKWKSGLLEAWRKTQNSINVTSSKVYGSTYYADALTLTTSGGASQFTSIDNIQITINKNGSMGFWHPVISNYSISNGTVTITYLLTNPVQNVSTTVVPYVYIVGRWK